MMIEANVTKSSFPSNIFIGENESKENVYNRLKDILDTKKLSNIIFNKASNNKVGYYLIRDNNKYFKIYILPKHISLASTATMTQEEEAIKDFLHYLQVHITLQQKYERYRHHEYNIQSIIEIGIHHDDAITKVQNIEALTSFKFESILEKIYLFFKTHKSTQRTSIAYTSQTIKHKLDLAKNIKEPNKTKIHQSKYAEFIYSDVANIAYAAIKLFIHKKINLLEGEENKNHLLKKTNAIQRLLKQKFKVASSTRITISALVGHKTHKFFKKKPSFNQLYSHILMLFGIERFYDEDNNVTLHYSDTIDTFLIQPELLYEWYVYDHLKKSLTADRYRIKLDNVGAPSKDNTFFENKEERTKKIYHFVDPAIQFGERSAKPDIIIEDILEDKLYIVDVKWKRLKTYNKQNHTYTNNNKSILLNDILKLKRDCEVYQEKQDLYALLIYCEAEERVVKEHLNDEYTAPFDVLKESTFLGYIRQLKIPTYRQEHIESFDITNITEKAINTPIPAILPKSLSENLSENKFTLLNELSSYSLNYKDIGDIVSTQMNSTVLMLDKEIRKTYTIDEILNDSKCKSLKVFLNRYEKNGCLESECVDFIYSAASSMFYFSQHKTRTYDYSLSASGIWKAIEVELNASILFLLRWHFRICDDSCYFTQREDSPNDFIQTSPKSLKQVVYLTNSRKDPPRLDNILLGSFPHLMKNINPNKHNDRGRTLNAFTPIYNHFYKGESSIQSWAKKISDFLFKVVSVRNPYTHKDTMNYNTYETFITYTFDNKVFNFSDLIELKKNIKQYMADNPIDYN